MVGSGLGEETKKLKKLKESKKKRAGYGNSWHVGQYLSQAVSFFHPADCCSLTDMREKYSEISPRQ